MANSTLLVIALASEARIPAWTTGATIGMRRTKATWCASSFIGWYATSMAANLSHPGACASIPGSVSLCEQYVWYSQNNIELFVLMRDGVVGTRNSSLYASPSQQIWLRPDAQWRNRLAKKRLALPKLKALETREINRSTVYQKPRQDLSAGNRCP